MTLFLMSLRLGRCISTSAAVLSLALSVRVGAQRGAESFPTDDPRWDLGLSVSCDGSTVQELLKTISTETGLSVAASGEAADDKVLVYGPVRPVRAILGDLAALFNYHWSVEKTQDGGSRYVLKRDLKASRYEEGLRQSANRRILAKMEEQVAALNDSPEKLAERAENDPIRRILSSEEGRLATMCYAALSPTQRENLLTRR